MLFFKKNKKAEKEKILNVNTVIKGTVIDIKDTKDPMFSEEVLGKGVGIIAKDNKIIAPVDGTISTFFPTKHAIGITSDNGIEILIHIGIDTVELNGKYFKALQKQGEYIKRGDSLLEVDFDGIINAGYDATILMVITNSQNYREIRPVLGDKDLDDVVIEIELG